MRFFGTTTRRVVFAILVTALIPLVSALLISRAIVARVSAAAFQPEFSAHLTRALGVYADLAKALKQQMRAEAQVIAASGELGAAARARDTARVEAALAKVGEAHPLLAQVRVETCGGKVLGRRDRPINPKVERSLEVRRALGPPETGDAIDCADGEADPSLILVATFATPRARLDELEILDEFMKSYTPIAYNGGARFNDIYFKASATLLAITLILAVAVGVLVARPVTQRIGELASATRPVAEGDLSVRVHFAGRDEVADLGRAFNHMLEELDRSRARVEFLKRMSEWQKVARRLAHEIKNPLTPIQLAVEECHRRYAGDDPEYRRILQTTLEVVEEEVGSLRRLVGEFSSFARLPRAELEEADLAAFLREQGARLAARDVDEGEGEGDRDLLGAVDLAFEVPDDPMPAAIDREMLHRVLVNVVRNAAQALRDARRRDRGHVRVAARAEGGRYVICVDDDGPGIAPEIAETIFDPYVTTKRDGTGLGLSIVKKIVVDHGGTIDAEKSPLGGARFRITIPRAGTPEARAAIEREAPSSRRAPDAPPSSSRLPS